MNNATSKFGTWDHYSFSFLSVRSGATIFPRLGEGWRVRRMIVRSETSRKLLRSEPSSHWGRHIHHSLLMPRNSHISGWRTPWRGLFLASFILSFSLSLSLSKPGRTSFLHKSRAFNARFERGRTGVRVWVRDGTRRILRDVYSTVLYFRGWNGRGEGEIAGRRHPYPACGEVEILLAGLRTKACGIEWWINKRGKTSVLAR